MFNGTSTLQRIYRLLAHPAKEWDNIAQEYPTEGILWRTYALPWVLACTLTDAVFAALYAADAPFVRLFLTAVVSGVSLSGGYFLARYLCNAWVQRLLSGHILREDCTKVVTYSFTVVWGIHLLVAVFPGMIFLQVLNLYVVYLAWEGCRVVIRPDEQKAGAVVIGISVILLAAVPVLDRLLCLLLPNARL